MGALQIAQVADRLTADSSNKQWRSEMPRKNTDSVEVPKIIAEANWNDLVRRLLAYTRFLIGKQGIEASRHSLTPQHYIEEAITLVLEGRNDTRIDSHRTLFATLAATIGMLLRRDWNVPSFADSVTDQANPPVIQFVPPTELMLYLASCPEALRDVPARKFEEVMAELFADVGYSVELTKPTRDDGVDIIAIGRSTTLGISEKYLVQCKRYARDNHVGVSVVRELLGVGVHWPSTGLIIATTSTFTTPARTLALNETVRWRLHLRDYDDITQWMQIYAARRRHGRG